jgi:hypothetical protein
MAYIGRTPTNAALTASDLADGIVSSGKIAADAVTSAKIADNAVVTAAINADAVTDAKIADDVVGTEHLTANEVDTTALGADAVTGAQLADDAVNSEHYTDGSIDTAHIADGQVTTAKLATAVFTGATDIGANIVDADLFLMDDGAGGTIRKTTASRLKTYAGGSTVAVSHVQDTTNYSQSNQGETVFGSGLSFTPDSTSSQVVAIIEAHIGVANDGSDNDARTLFRFYSTNSSGNSIKELDTYAEFGHVNMQASNHEMYGYVTSTISNCQRDSSNNVVIKLTAVSNQDSGTTVYLYNHRAVFLEIG